LSAGVRELSALLPRGSCGSHQPCDPSTCCSFPPQPVIPTPVGFAILPPCVHCAFVLACWGELHASADAREFVPICPCRIEHLLCRQRAWPKGLEVLWRTFWACLFKVACVKSMDSKVPSCCVH
jgi:hypothetical protein